MKKETMKQAQLMKPKHFLVKDTDIPEISDNEVLVKVLYCGICGSDLHAFLGSNPFAKYPVVSGHEYAGVIEKVGKEVKNLSHGDLVTGEPIRNCGNCMYCHAGLYNHCLKEEKKIGGFGEYTVVRSDRAYKIPEGISPAETALVEPLAFALHTLKLADTDRTDKILILGAGTIGQMLTVAAKSYGVENIAITDVFPKKLNLAKENGCTETILVERGKEKEIVQNVLGQDNIGIVFDCVCNEASMDTSIKVVKKNGKIVIVGVAEKKCPVDLGMVMFNELKILGTRMYNNGDFRNAIRLMDEKRVDVSQFISNTYALEDIQHAFMETIEKKDRYLKCLIKV